MEWVIIYTGYFIAQFLYICYQIALKLH